MSGTYMDYRNETFANEPKNIVATRPTEAGWVGLLQLLSTQLCKVEQKCDHV